MSDPDRAATLVGPVGVVGLGRMGLPVATNLARSGAEVMAVASDEPRRAALVEIGAIRADSLQEIGARCRTILTILPDLVQVREVCEGESGLLADAEPGTIVVIMGTVDPVEVRRYAGELSARGFGLVDAPMSGGVEGAAAGTLSIMMGGTDADVAAARPVLERVSTTLRHLGPPGSGALSKACNQIVVAGTLAVLGEAIVLGRHGGLDPRVLLEVLGGGLAASRLLTNKWSNLADHDFTPTGSAAFQHKDLGFALHAGRTEGVALPVTAVVDQLFGAMRWRGRGEDDHSGVLQVIEVLSGDSDDDHPWANAAMPVAAISTS